MADYAREHRASSWYYGKPPAPIAAYDADEKAIDQIVSSPRPTEIRVDPAELLDAAIAHACTASRKRGVCPGLLVEELDNVEQAIRGAFVGVSVTVDDVARMLAELGGER